VRIANVIHVNVVAIHVVLNPSDVNPVGFAVDVTSAQLKDVYQNGYQSKLNSAKDTAISAVTGYVSLIEDSQTFDEGLSLGDSPTGDYAVAFATLGMGAGVAAESGLGGSVIGGGKSIMQHYTTNGARGSVVETGIMIPSETGFGGPGIYFTDIAPNTIAKTDLMQKLFFRVTNETWKKVENYITLDMSGLKIEKLRENVYLYRTTEPLDVSNRIISHGKNKSK
jgi:hypothetical protein